MPESVLQEPWPRSSNDEFQKSTPVDWLASNREGRILMAARIRSFRLHLEFRASTHTMGDQNVEGKRQFRKRNLLKWQDRDGSHNRPVQVNT
jgi:hypothetical protein